MIMSDKKGVSPVIATVLLIALALVLALIVFLWARGVVAEKVQKFGEPIENSCANVVFDAEANYAEGNINIVNKGNVPIYGIVVIEKSAGSAVASGSFDKTIGNGEYKKIDMAGQFNAGETIIIVPKIIGETSSSKMVYTCEDKYGKEVTVM